ncbi:MAG: peptide chain release factor 1, partial [Planctomycetes bacterium]|nr:peptide chain release factor 1 [Planctomycetota bacterium]
VHMQDEKSQHKNKAKALRIIRSRVYEHHQAQLDAERDESRRTQTGSGDRSQRIRTYNFPQNRCTDHRLGKNFSLDRIMQGALTPLITALIAWGHQQELEA